MSRSSIPRRIARAHTSRREYEQALLAYDEAAARLCDGPESGGDAWWLEWIQLQLGRVWVHNWLGSCAPIAALIDEARPVVEKHASASERANFYQALVSMGFLRDRYTISPDTLEYSEVQLRAEKAAGDEQRLAVACFMHAFTLLWNGSLPEAELLARQFLEVAERTGDLSLQSRCLTYLSVLYRKRGQRREVDRYSQRAHEVAETAGMPEYVGTALANRAWLAWCEGDVEGVAAKGSAALAKWRGLPPGHPSCGFRWTALLPLIGASLRGGATEYAVEQARDVLEPTQQRLHSPLPDTLHAAIDSWEREDRPLARRNSTSPWLLPKR